jgi:hypothetical protein
MRENRLYGSEGGEAKSLPYPYHSLYEMVGRQVPETGRVVNVSRTCGVGGPEARPNQRTAGSGRVDCFAMTGRAQPV